MGEVGERVPQAGPLLWGEGEGELLEAREAGVVDAADDVAAGVGDAHAADAPVLLVLATVELAAAQSASVVRLAAGRLRPSPLPSSLTEISSSASSSAWSAFMCVIESSSSSKSA